MENLFKILFWFIGYIYWEDKYITNHGEFSYKNIYARLKTQKIEQGWQSTLLTGEYKKPFLDRWYFFKIVSKQRDRPISTNNN